jgi:hypothetical protein
MDSVSDKDKKKFSHKLLTFQKMGLESYGDYLEDQREMSEKTDHKKEYLQYIEDQIQANKAKIDKINEKL